MYRRIGPKPERIKASAKRNQEDICVCKCKSEVSRKGLPTPEANLAGDKLAVDFEING